MHNKRFFVNLPIKRLLRMLSSEQEREDVWMEMDPANHAAGRSACSPHHHEALMESAATELGERIDDLSKRLDAIERQATAARRG